MAAIVGSPVSLVLGSSVQETASIEVPSGASTALIIFSSWSSPDGSIFESIICSALSSVTLTQLPKSGNLYNAGFAVAQVNSSGTVNIEFNATSVHEAGPICFIVFLSNTTASEVVRNYDIERSDFSSVTGEIPFESGDLVLCFESAESGDIPTSPTNFSSLSTQVNGNPYTARARLSIRETGDSPLSVQSTQNIFECLILLALREVTVNPPVTKKRIILVS